MSNCNQLPDDVLVSRAVSGDTQAYAELLQRYRGLVWSICLSYVSNLHDCEDVTQEVFVKAYVCLGQLRSRQLFGPWISQLARRMCMTRNRSKARYEAAISRYSTHRNGTWHYDSVESGRSLERQDELIRVRAAIQRLPKRTREAVYLHFCEGWSVHDAADVLGVSYSAMLKRLRYGRSLLQTNLERDAAGDLTALRSNRALTKGAMAIIPMLRMPRSGVPAGDGWLGPFRSAGARTPVQQGVIAAVGVAIVAVIVVQTGFRMPHFWIASTATPHEQRTRAQGEPVMDADANQSAMQARHGESTTTDAPRTQDRPGGDSPLANSAVDGSSEARNGSITGTVYDADTGQGISGVEVTAYLASELYRNRRTATTDLRGTYRITGLASDKYEVRRGRAHGYPDPVRDERREITLAKSGTATSPIDFAVSRGLTVSGVVVDQRGTPLKNVRVRGTSGRNGTLRETRSAADGTFELLGLSQTPALMLSAEGEGVLSPLDDGFPFDSSLAGVKLVAVPASTVSGRVTDETGRPVPRAYVVARDMHDSYFAVQRIRHAQTDADGYFALQDVGAGTQSIFAQRTAPPMLSDHGDTIMSIEAGSNVSNVALTLPAGKSLEVVVVDDNDNAIHGATVRWSGGSAGGGRTGADGHYTIEGLDAAGSYRIYASHNSFTSRVLTDVTPASEDVVVALKRLGGVRGRVIDESTRKPVDEFEIMLTSNPLQVIDPVQVARESVRTANSDGAFQFPGVSCVPSKLVVRARGYATEVVDVTPSPNDTADLEVALQPGATIHGQVQVDGAAAQYARVVMSQEFAMPQYFGAETDASGRFQIEGLREGEAGIYAVLNSPANENKIKGDLHSTISLVAAHDHEIVLDIPAAAD